MLAQPAIDVTIVGAYTSGQLEQTAPAGDIHLSKATLQEIERIMREAVPIGLEDLRLRDVGYARDECGLFHHDQVYGATGQCLQRGAPVNSLAEKESRIWTQQYAHKRRYQPVSIGFP